MAITDVQCGYWYGERLNSKSVVVRAEKISKTAWMDLYYDLYQQTHGESNTSQGAVLEDAERRLKLLKLNGIRR